MLLRISEAIGIVVLLALAIGGLVWLTASLVEVATAWAVNRRRAAEHEWRQRLEDLALLLERDGEPSATLVRFASWQPARQAYEAWRRSRVVDE